MSEVVFYKVAKVKEILESVIDLDKNPLPINYSWVSENKAEDWEKELGQKIVVRYNYVDLSNAIKDIIGIYPQVITSHYSFGKYDYICYDEDNNEIGKVSSELVNKYEYKREEVVYVYQKNILTVIEFSSCFTVKTGLVILEDVYQMMHEALEYDVVELAGTALYSLCEVMFTLLNKELVYVVVD